MMVLNIYLIFRIW